MSYAPRANELTEGAVWAQVCLPVDSPQEQAQDSHCMDALGYAPGTEPQEGVPQDA